MNSKLKRTLEENKMSLIVSLPENKEEFADAAIRAGADGIKFHVNVSHRASGNVFGGLSEYEKVFREVRSKFDGPMGLVLGEDPETVRAIDLARVSEAGFDYFSLYGSHITSGLLTQQTIAKTVAIDDGFGFEEIEAIESFSMDALEVSIVQKEDYGTPLHFQDVLRYAAIVKKTCLPLIIPSQKKLVTEDLKVMAEIGVKAVMLGAVVTGNSPDTVYKAVSEFRHAMDCLMEKA